MLLCDLTVCPQLCSRSRILPRHKRQGGPPTAWNVALVTTVRIFQSHLESEVSSSTRGLPY